MISAVELCSHIYLKFSAITLIDTQRHGPVTIEIFMG